MMQDYQDEQEIQVKKLAKFDVEREIFYRKMPVYDYLFHISALKNEE